MHGYLNMLYSLTTIYANSPNFNQYSLIKQSHTECTIREIDVLIIKHSNITHSNDTHFYFI